MTAGGLYTLATDRELRTYNGVSNLQKNVFFLFVFVSV